MDIYDRIKEKREALGLSQYELALKTGYKSRSSINKIEKGQRDINQRQIEDFANALETTTAYLMGWESESSFYETPYPTSSGKGKLIPILGQVVAGIPIDAVEEILGYEEISKSMASQGEFFALQIKGSSMEPRMHEGDVVIVQKQSDIDSGDTAIVLVNGDEATVKKVIKFTGGISLIPNNSSYDVITYTNKEIRSLPVSIIGKVVELRGKY